MQALAFALVINTSVAETPFGACGDLSASESTVIIVGQCSPFEGTTYGRTAFRTNAISPTVDAERAIDEIESRAVADQARSIVKRLRIALSAFDLTNVPKVRGDHHDDGSFSLELRFPDRRLAFTIESNPAESGWHFVSSRSSGDTRAYGGLSDQDLRPLLSWALRQTPNS